MSEPPEQVPEHRELPPRRFVASSMVRAMVRAEIRKFADDILAPAIGQSISELMRESEVRAAALEAKIVGLQDAMTQFAYKGAWTERQYRRGNFVSMCGQIYHANADTTARPGTDATWVLAVRSGRDGRDGKDAAPAEPPEPRKPTMRPQR
jgi:hypothetical protein